MKIVKVFFLFFISTSILLISFAVVSSKFYLHLHENKYQSHQNLTFDYRYAVDNIVDYLNDKTDSLEFGSQEGADDVVMSERGLAHMIDVKGLYQNGKIFFALSIVLSAILGIKLWDKKELISTLKKIWIAPILLVVFGMVVLMFFDILFVLFHQIFFSNDLWILSSGDPLILMFPSQFFMITALVILTITTVAFCGLYWFSRKTKIEN